jgi:hypothetical protein
MRMGGPHSLSGHFGVEKNSLPLKGINPGHEARTPLLYRLLNIGLFNIKIFCSSAYVDMRPNR